MSCRTCSSSCVDTQNRFCIDVQNMFYMSPIQIRWEKNGKRAHNGEGAMERKKHRDSALMERDEKIQLYNTLKPNPQFLNAKR